ncbi:MAG: membrane associated rhomboid family serine protease [Paraglaciecola sp.]|jgi:membrane associated rhomboid family serine protease
MTLKNYPLTSRQQFRIVGWIFLLVTVIEILNLFSGRALSHFGNIPRYIPGLLGIISGPFIHASLAHYLSNIVPLCVLSFLMLQYGIRRFVLVSLFCLVLTGLLVWLFARSANHLGISGLVYSFFGFLLLAGLLSGRLKLFAISLLVGIFYGGLIFGVLPTRGFVSWESHLFGFISGLIAARLWTRN